MGDRVSGPVGCNHDLSDLAFTRGRVGSARRIQNLTPLKPHDNSMFSRRLIVVSPPAYLGEAQFLIQADSRAVGFAHFKIKEPAAVQFVFEQRSRNSQAAVAGQDRQIQDFVFTPLSGEPRKDILAHHESNHFTVHLSDAALEFEELLCRPLVMCEAGLLDSFERRSVAYGGRTNVNSHCTLRLSTRPAVPSCPFGSAA